MKRSFAAPQRIALLAASVLLLGAACGGGTPAGVTPTTPAGETPEVTPAASPTPRVAFTPPPLTPGPAPSPSPSALTPGPIPMEGTRGPIEKVATAPAPSGALLVDVRTGLHEGFDRIVFEFEEGLPGYRIEYVEPPITADASGLPVEIDGNAFLRVRFSMAAAHDPSSGDPTYTGPSEVASGLPSLLEAELTGDFEGVLTWVLGLNQEVNFRVIDLESPFRVAIDVAHQ